LTDVAEARRPKMIEPPLVTVQLPMISCSNYTMHYSFVQLKRWKDTRIYMVRRKTDRYSAYATTTAKTKN